MNTVSRMSRMYFSRLRQFFFAVCYLSPVVFTIACGRLAGVGVGGHYNEAKIEFVKPHGDMDKVMSNLSYVMDRDPLYQDSLTLLGRAYYQKGRYQDAFQVFTRAVAVNKEDEIGWIMLGLTQLRLRDDVKGLESLKGGLTLFSKASKEGYRGIEFWDKKGLVRAALSRAAFDVTRGPENKEAVIRSTEILLRRVDDEEWLGKGEQRDKDTRADR